MTKKQSMTRWSDIRVQIEEMARSDIDSDMFRVWVFLLAIKVRGYGTPRLGDNLTMVDAEVCAKELEKIGRVKRSNGVWAPVMFVDEKEVDGWDEKDARDERALQKMETYQALRSREGLEPVVDNAKNKKYFRDLSTWLDERGIKFKAYLRFAIERTEFMRDRMAYPTPQILAGTWLRDEWTSGTGNGKKSNGTKHAGKSYDTPEGLRELLVAHGFDRAELWSDAQIRHVHSWAEDMAHFPDHYPDPDPDYAPEIEWLRGRMEGSC